MPGIARCCAAQPLLSKTILVLAEQRPSWFDDTWMIDATPVRCGMSQDPGQTPELAGHASYGYCASHSRFYWGLKPFRRRQPIMWCLAPPQARRTGGGRAAGAQPPSPPQRPAAAGRKGLRWQAVPLDHRSHRAAPAPTIPAGRDLPQRQPRRGASESSQTITNRLRPPTPSFTVRLI